MTKVDVKWVYAPAFTGEFYAPDFFDLNNNDVVDFDEEEQNLFNFSSGRTNKQTFYFPTSLWDKRFVPEKS